MVCCYATICCYFFFIICFDFSPIWCNHKWFVNEMFLRIWSAAGAHKSIYLHEWFGYAVVKMIEISSLMKTNPIEMWFKLICFYCLHLIYVINESMIWFKRITNIENLVIKMNGIIDIGLSKPFTCGIV